MAYNFNPAFEQALPYASYLSHHATDQQRARWDRMYEQVALTQNQQELLRGFKRQMRVLCVSGTWCGDCSNACPILARFAEIAPCIDLRFIQHPSHSNGPGSLNSALMDELSICGGARVPVGVFMSEDGYECGRFGDRTLATYRAKVAAMEGPSCPIGVTAPDNLHAENVREWLEQFERIQLMLQTSPRLMQRYALE